MTNREREYIIVIAEQYTHKVTRLKHFKGTNSWHAWEEARRLCGRHEYIRDCLFLKKDHRK